QTMGDEGTAMREYVISQKTIDIRSHEDTQVIRALGQPVRLRGQRRRRGRGDSCCEGVIGVVADCSDDIPTALQPPQAASFCGLDAMAVPSGLIESNGGQTLEHTVKHDRSGLGKARVRKRPLDNRRLEITGRRKCRTCEQTSSSNALVQGRTHWWKGAPIDRCSSA